MKKSPGFANRAVTMLLSLMLCSVGAFADGTEELSTPSIAIASGTGIVAAGTGLLTQPGTINLTLPAGVSVNQVLLYWEGQMATNVVGDNTINVDGNSVTGTLIGGPTVFFSGGVSSAFRADITGLGLVGPGLNTLTIDGMDFTGANNGAGILVIFDDPADAESDIQIVDGLDLAFVDFAPPLDTTVLKEFTFNAASVDRTATLANFFSSVEGDASGFGDERPNVVEIRVLDSGNNAVNSINLINALDSNDGDEWDTLITSVLIPAGAVKLTVQALSEDRQQSENRPASLAWIASGLSVPPHPDIDIRKEAEGPDSRSFPSGSDVSFTIVVENIGNVDLTDVEVTDEQVPGCAKSIGDLAVGASTSYACVAPNVTSSFENVACVEGISGGITVTDCDPSSVEIEAGDEGCTPGYWKNHLDAWPPTGYSPGQSVGSVFASAAAFPNLASASLLGALNFGGGPGAEGGAKILLRAAVAALLNASHPGVSYPQSPAMVIAAVNGALASEDRDTMLSLATTLDGLNNLGCPLN